MKFIDLKKSKLLNLIDKNCFVTDDDTFIAQVCETLEKEGNVKLQQQISDSLINEIKSKAASLSVTWKRLNDDERQTFLKHANDRYCRFSLKSVDVLAEEYLEYLLMGYEGFKSRLEIAMQENVILNGEIRILKAQLKSLNAQLAQKEAEISLTLQKLSLLQKDQKSKFTKFVEPVKSKVDSFLHATIFAKKDENDSNIETLFQLKTPEPVILNCQNGKINGNHEPIKISNDSNKSSFDSNTPDIIVIDKINGQNEKLNRNSETNGIHSGSNKSKGESLETPNGFHELNKIPSSAASDDSQEKVIKEKLEENSENGNKKVESTEDNSGSSKEPVFELKSTEIDETKEKLTEISEVNEVILKNDKSESGAVKKDTLIELKEDSESLKETLKIGISVELKDEIEEVMDYLIKKCLEAAGLDSTEADLKKETKKKVYAKRGKSRKNKQIDEVIESVIEKSKDCDKVAKPEQSTKSNQPNIVLLPPPLNPMQQQQYPQNMPFFQSMNQFRSSQTFNQPGIVLQLPPRVPGQPLQQPRIVFIQPPQNNSQQPTQVPQTQFPQLQNQPRIVFLQQPPQPVNQVIQQPAPPPPPTPPPQTQQQTTQMPQRIVRVIKNHRDIDDIYINGLPELGLKPKDAPIAPAQPNFMIQPQPRLVSEILQAKQLLHEAQNPKPPRPPSPPKPVETKRKNRSISRKNRLMKRLAKKSKKIDNADGVSELESKKKTRTSTKRKYCELLEKYRMVRKKQNNKFKRTRKLYHDCTNRHRKSIREQLKDLLKEYLGSHLETMGLCIQRVIIIPIQIERTEIKLEIREQGENEVEVEKVGVDKLLYHKDKYSMSDRAYHSLRSTCGLKLHLPSINKIREHRAKIDLRFNILTNEKGVFVSAESKISHRVEAFFERKYKTRHPQIVNDFTDEIIHIRLAADGTNIGRCLKLLNFTFTILNEGPRSLTASGNYTLGIFELENENYDNLVICFKELVDELRNLKEIKIGPNTLGLVFYYSGDWKMLAHSLGIQSANSKYPCVWCKCCKDDFSDRSLEWSITDPTKGARSLEELIKTVQLPNNSKTVKYGYDKLPLFKDVVPINRYMIDMLHLFLRISDSLINLLVKDCTLIDKFESWTLTRFDVTEFKHLHAFQKFLNEKCKVNFKFVWLSETKKLTWRDLVGPEKIKLFEVFNLKEIFPEHDKLESLQKLWDDFYDIINAVKRVKIEHSDVKRRTQEWLDLFLTIYNKTTVTPYIHAFVAHLHEFVFLYKDINAFNLQGLEKLNDLTTCQYFKGTNKSDNALTQMLKKRNRMEFLRLSVEDNDMDTQMP